MCMLEENFVLTYQNKNWNCQTKETFFKYDQFTNRATELLLSGVDFDVITMHGIPYDQYVKELNKKVVISVLGGVAYVESCPVGIEVEIIDYDDEEEIV